MQRLTGRFIVFSHGASGEAHPLVARQTEAGIEPVTQPFSIGEIERDERGGDVTGQRLENCPDGLSLIGGVVCGCERVHRLSDCRAPVSRSEAGNASQAEGCGPRRRAPCPCGGANRNPAARNGNREELSRTWAVIL